MKLGQHIANYAFKNGDSVFKDGVTLSDVEKALSGFDENLKGLSKGETTQLFEDTTFLKSYTDAKRAEGIETREHNLKAQHEEALKKLDADLRAELNPQEDERDKKIRELLEKDKARDEKERMTALQDALSVKAKELNFDPMMARDFAAFGADAEDKLAKYAEFMNTTIESGINSKVKERFSNSTPKVKIGESGLTSLSDTDLNALAVSDPSMKPAVMQEIRKRMIPTQ